MFHFRYSYCEPQKTRAGLKEIDNLHQHAQCFDMVLSKKNPRWIMARQENNHFEFRLVT